MFRGKHILLGITGSIAAYKAALLVRLLVKSGAEVKVIMTEMAKQFITPLTMATLSKNPILVEFYNPENGDWNSHVSLGEWADMYLIAPASANSLAKMATGVADNLLLTTYLSAKCPVLIAPAMDLDMYAHPATQENLAILRSRGVLIVEPASGELASGLDGKGRMEEPEEIFNSILAFFKGNESLLGKRVLITAGPTVEQIDPVRYISNYSSGKMGYSIADECRRRGAEVFLVSGPTSIKPSFSDINVFDVKSAKQMYDSCSELYEKQMDIVVFCAAVADYTVDNHSERKLKRSGSSISLDLVPTKDIAASLGSIKKRGVLHVGFALETDNELENANAKLEKKSLDMIVLNSLNDVGAGFTGDTNKVSMIFKGGEKLEYQLKSKVEVAVDIVNNIEKLLKLKCLDD